MVCFQPYYKFNERKKLLKICPSLVIICLKCVAFCGMMKKRQGKMRKFARKVCEEIMNNRRLITERERPLTASGFRVMKGEREFITYQRDATIRVWHQPNPDSYAPHFHSAIEVCVPLLGGCEVAVKGKEYHVQAGEVLFVPPTRRTPCAWRRAASVTSSSLNTMLHLR